jgi:hypothetical protein
MPVSISLDGMRTLAADEIASDRAFLESGGYLVIASQRRDAATKLHAAFSLKSPVNPAEVSASRPPT